MRALKGLSGKNLILVKRHGRGAWYSINIVWILDSAAMARDERLATLKDWRQRHKEQVYAATGSLPPPLPLSDCETDKDGFPVFQPVEPLPSWEELDRQERSF